MSDQDIMQQVKGLLATLISDENTVNVEVEGGVAYLEGVAATPAQKQAIEQAISRLPGVRQVINCLANEHIAQLSPRGSSFSLAGYQPYTIALNTYHPD